MKKYLVKIYKGTKKFKKNILPQYFTATPFLSSFYYLIFSNQFRREQHAVLKGKVKYLNEIKSERSSQYILIRNTHRIEKGLLMRPRRDVFALKFITETVDAFVKVWRSENMTEGSQNKWFFDVLNDYFQSSGKHPVIDQQSKKFYKIVGESEKHHIMPKSTPYHRIESQNPGISFEDFYQLTRYRRSVRWFLNKKVPYDLVDKAVLAANQAPSACNRQPFEYHIIDDPQLLRQVVSLPMGVSGYLDNIPMLVVVIGNLDAYFDERDRHLIYIDASLANMNFMLALETLGLSSCSINWPDIEVLERKMERVLKLSKHQRPVMCMAVGYPDPEGKVAFSEKRNLEELRKIN